jgi:hypothetical protein
MTFWLIILTTIITGGATARLFKGFKEDNIWLAVWSGIEILAYAFAMTIGG